MKVRDFSAERFALLQEAANLMVAGDLKAKVLELLQLCQNEDVYHNNGSRVRSEIPKIADLYYRKGGAFYTMGEPEKSEPEKAKHFWDLGKVLEMFFKEKDPFNPYNQHYAEFVFTNEEISSKLEFVKAIE